MRNLLIGIFLAGVAASPALAQDNHDNRWHHDQQQGRGEGRQERQQRAPQGQQPPAAVQEQARGQRSGGGNFYREQQQVQVQQGQPGGWARGRFEGRAPSVPQGEVPQQAYGYRGPVQVERNSNGGWTRTQGYRGGGFDQRQARDGGFYGQRGTVQQQYRGGRDYAARSWNRNWRNDERYDWRRYRDSHRSVFRLGVYIDPFGYGYQPFSIGYRLPPVYFGQQYWIDPAMYELPYPPPGTQWVRYWNDALLVDMYSGNVIDVIHGFFW